MAGRGVAEQCEVAIADKYIFPPEAGDCCLVVQGLGVILLLTSGYLCAVHTAADRRDEDTGEGVFHRVVDTLYMSDVRRIL